MADTKKAYKVAGVISFGSLLTVLALIFLISDRGEEKGVAKATLKMQVEANTEKIETEVGAVSGRIDHLEEHADETEKVLNGKEGLISTVEVIKSKLEYISKQGDALGDQNKLILQKLDDLKKE